jgi:hypothetical protein
MSWKKRRFSVVITAGLVVVLAGSLLALGDAVAAPGSRRHPKPVITLPKGPIPTPVAVVQPASLQVAYRLDPWMLSGNYGSGFWATPAVLGPTTQGDNKFVVEARAGGFASGGAAIKDAQWSSSDPALVRVNPAGHGTNDVRITVAKAGQSRVHVSAAGLSKDLVITAEAKDEALLVTIAQ